MKNKRDKVRGKKTWRVFESGTPEDIMITESVQRVVVYMWNDTWHHRVLWESSVRSNEAKVCYRPASKPSLQLRAPTILLYLFCSTVTSMSNVLRLGHFLLSLSLVSPLYTEKIHRTFKHLSRYNLQVTVRSNVRISTGNPPRIMLQCFSVRFVPVLYLSH